jgi:hypothetical protein
LKVRRVDAGAREGLAIAVVVAFAPGARLGTAIAVRAALSRAAGACIRTALLADEFMAAASISADDEVAVT